MNTFYIYEWMNEAIFLYNKYSLTSWGDKYGILGNKKTKIKISEIKLDFVVHINYFNPPMDIYNIHCISF